MDIVNSILGSIKEALGQRLGELTCADGLKHGIELSIIEDCVVLSVTGPVNLNRNQWHYNVGRIPLNDPSIEIVDAVVKLINDTELSSIFEIKYGMPDMSHGAGSGSPHGRMPVR